MNRFSKLHSLSPSAAILSISTLICGCGCESQRSQNISSQEQELAPIASLSDEQRFLKDASARDQVLMLKKRLVETGRLSVDETEILKTIHTEYSGSYEVTETFIRALSANEDWDGIIEAYDRVPSEHVDSQLRVAACIRANRFAESVDLLLSNPESLEAPENAWYLGYSLYHAGRHREALEVLESLETRVSGRQLVDALSLMGLAYVQVDDDHRAATAFEKVLTLEPNHLASVANLASVWQRLGRVDQARELDQKALALRSEQVKNEARAARISSLTQQLTQAWDAQNWNRSREIIERLMPDADAQLRAKLELYLIEILKHGK